VTISDEKMGGVVKNDTAYSCLEKCSDG